MIHCTAGIQKVGFNCYSINHSKGMYSTCIWGGYNYATVANFKSYDLARFTGMDCGSFVTKKSIIMSA